jgi:hypothetical protein
LDKRAIEKASFVQLQKQFIALAATAIRNVAAGARL